MTCVLKSKVILANGVAPFENSCHECQGYRTAFYKPVTNSCDSIGTKELKSVKLRREIYTIIQIFPACKKQVCLFSTALRSGVALQISK